MRIFDIKVKNNLFKAVFQCVLAMIVMYLLLFFIDFATYPAILASMGATIFIVFTMPDAYVSSPRALIGGYLVGILTGIICSFLYSLDISKMLSITDYQANISLAAFAVGLSIFVMISTDTEHPPASGLALGLVINEWDFLTVVLLIVLILSLTVIKKMLSPFLVDLL